MRQYIVHAAWYGLGVIALVLAVEGQALAGTVPSAPEIDGSTLSAGLGVLAAGVMIIRARRK